MSEFVLVKDHVFFSKKTPNCISAPLYMLLSFERLREKCPVWEHPWEGCAAKPVLLSWEALGGDQRGVFMPGYRVPKP